MENTNELETELVSLFAQHTALTHRLLVKIREFDESKEWANQGALSCAHWLNWRVGLGLGAARAKIRTAHALAALPKIDEAFASGQVSYTKVRAITRVATPKTQTRLLDVALEATGSQLEKIVRGRNKIDKAQEAKRDEKRRCDIYFDDDGMCVVAAKLRPEEGAMLMKAIEAARSKGQNLADALVEVATRAINGSAESNGERYHVVVHTDAAHEETAVEGRLGDKVRVSAELARRLTCDATTTTVVHDADGAIIDVGRKTRRISTKLRLALTQRDGGCRFPGCTNRFTDAHHVRHWADGGKTSLKNLMLLCGYHHGFIHDGKALLGEDQIFRHKDGTPITNAMPITQPPTLLPYPWDMPLPEGRPHQRLLRLRALDALHATKLRCPIEVLFEHGVQLLSSEDEMVPPRAAKKAEATSGRQHKHCS